MSAAATIRIGQAVVGTGNPPFIVAEVAQAHDGSLGTAHAYIDAAARAGAHAIKFQTHIAEAESTRSEAFRVKFSRQDANRYDYWKRMEFTEAQWRGLAQHAGERGIVFLSSPFSLEAVDLLERVGVPAWKVGAGEVTNVPMLERMAGTGKPVILSSGLSTWAELDAAVGRLQESRGGFAVLQTTTAYPCPPEKLGLNVLAELRARYRCPVGLSDHSARVAAGVAAVALGADIVEVHVVFSRECFGPDTVASLTTAELADLVQGAAFVHRAVARPVDKDAMAAELGELRALFAKSLVARASLPSGHRLTEADIAFKKPGTGLPPSSLGQVVGRRLKRALEHDEPIAEVDLE